MFVDAGSVQDHNFHPKIIFRGGTLERSNKTFDGAKISLKRFSIDPGSKVLAILKCQVCCISLESNGIFGKKDFNFEEVRNQYRRNFLESGLKNKQNFTQAEEYNF